MKLQKFVLILAITGMLSGCTNLTKEDQGVLLGGLFGGLLGSQFGKGNGHVFTTIVGTFAGGYLGRTIGHSLNQQDVLLHERAVEQTVIHGSNNGWANPHSGHRGYVIAGQYYRRVPSGYCREYREFVIIDGKEFSAHSVACQETDGTWRIVN